jgi:hypothetical protein
MNIKLFILILCAFSLLACSTGQKAVIKRDAAPAPLPKEQESLFKADFRYSPPWWQTAICLPFSSGSRRHAAGHHRRSSNK